MGQQGHRLLTVADIDADEPSALKIAEFCRWFDPLEDPNWEWLADSQCFNDQALWPAELRHARLDQIAQARAGPRLASPDPDAVGGFKGAVVKGGLHQLTEQEGIAAAGLSESLQGAPFDLATKHRCYQLVDLECGQGLNLQPLDEPVLPQRDERVRGRLPTSGRQNELDASHDSELVKHGRGVTVEQVGVVDANDEAAIGGTAPDVGDRGPKQVEAVGPDDLNASVSRCRAQQESSSRSSSPTTRWATSCGCTGRSTSGR